MTSQPHARPMAEIRRSERWLLLLEAVVFGAIVVLVVAFFTVYA